MSSTGKSSKNSSNQISKDKTKIRIDELQGIVQDLLRNDDNNKAVTVEQISLKLKEWKAELDEPSPEVSQNEGSLGSFSDLFRYLVEDDASSALSFLNNPDPQIDVNAHGVRVGDDCYFDEDYLVNQAPLEQKFLVDDQCKDPFSGEHAVASNADIFSQYDYYQFNPHHNVDQNIIPEFDCTSPCIESVGDQSSSVMCKLDPPSFIATKCALWDCVRPAKGMEGCQDYCDQFHADLAKKEGPPGSTPFMQRGGIGFNDDVLFATLIAKIRGRDVGIPECVGAATAKSLLNSPERFNLVLGDERLREWLFFDMPRRGPESKDKKQKSLPDHSGLGWHRSRTQMMAEFDGSKKSYYMDPQPLYNLELHLYVYEVSSCIGLALYRVELKIADEKKSPKGKSSDKSPVDLQKQIGQFPTEHLGDGSQFFKGDKSYITHNRYELGVQNQGYTSEESSSYGDCFLNLSPHKDGTPSFDESNPQFDLLQEDQSNHVIAECALWDCARPAQGSHYCSMFHCNLAYSEGQLSMHPVIRSRGISLKDGPLFSALGAKFQGKEVGIPECKGAATEKSPWNDPEHFNTYLFEGEMIREWLFFDEPKKAFESGNRNRRSLPDHVGRGWHSSRKQEMKEYGGVKKSYYMDPQPSTDVEWHLYEYVSLTSGSLILYRLALKKGKKSPKGKAIKDPIVDLQNKMGQLNAEFPSDNDETTADSNYDYRVQNQHGTRSFS